MTDNLKILTILSIFVFVLIGYFCFSSTFAKNQIIANSNDEKDNKNSKDISKINNKDEKKIKIENKKNTSWLIYVILLIIIIVVIAVIVIFVVNKKNEFKFKEESKKDFTKENFCPTFFTIHIPKAIEKSKEKGNEIDDAKEDADSFFEILASFLIPKDMVNKIDKVEISLSSRSCLCKVYSKYTISLKDILNEINNFALQSGELNYDDDDNKIDPFIKPLKNDVENVKSKIKESKTKIKEIEEKYIKNEFDSYLCAYLLYHLSETIGNNGIKVEISDPKKEKKDDIIDDIITEYFHVSSNVFFCTNYYISYDIIDEILKKLINDNQLQNVTYTES